jgi:hypothetical protein
MVGHSCLLVGHALDHLRQRDFVSFGQLLHALTELLTYAVHFAVGGGIERRQPFIIYHQRFDFWLREFRIFGVGLGVEVRFGVLELLFEVRFIGVELEPITEQGGFILGFLLAP